MSRKVFNNNAGIVYSTDPDFKIEEENKEKTTIVAAKQLLKVFLDRKLRAGKSVTLITGFQGIDDQLEELGKKLKTLCGTGGTVKDGQIIIQGDNREKVVNWLLKNGYSQAKKC